MAESAHSLEAFEQADVEFHLALATAANNSVNLRIFQAVRTPVHKTLRVTNRGYLKGHGDLSEPILNHKKLVDFALSGDAKVAIEVLENMIKRSRARVLNNM